MDEYGEMILPQVSIYKDILSLISEHSITMIDTKNKDILQGLIDEELEIVKRTVEGSIILVKAELAEIKKQNKIKPTTVTSIK